MNNIGSQWSKWDLHAHTPLDHEWINKPSFNGADNEEIIAKKKVFAREYIAFAESQNLSVIGVVDHNFCNSLDDSLLPFIIEESKNSEVVILPGFEITAKDGSGIHILVIFDENTDLTKIFDIVKACFPPGVNLCPTTGVPVSQYSISEIKNIVESSNLESVFIFAHADSKSGVLDKETITRTRRVEEWNNKVISITQLSKPIDSFNNGTFLSNVFKGLDPLYKRNMAYITASDCRTIDLAVTQKGRFHLGEKFSWIKAKPSFEGLKQIIYEPNLRVKTQVTNPYFDYPKAFFSKVEISNELDVFSNGRLYIDSVTIDLNRDLIAIIGGRGSGKSILLDHILKVYKNNEIKDNQRVLRIQENPYFKIEYTKSDLSKDVYSMNDENFLDYVHITQGEVKKIIEKPEEFSQVIFKMLSISSEIDVDMLVDINNKLSMYFSEVEGLEKFNIDNINQEKTKLEKYIQDLKTEENKSLIEEFQLNESKKLRINRLKLDNKDFIESIKNTEKSINDKLSEKESFLNEILEESLTFTKINFKELENELLSVNNKLDEKLEVLNNENDFIKKKFQEAGFSEDISTLTSKIIDYEQQLNKFNEEIIHINKIVTEISSSKKLLKDKIGLFKTSLESKKDETLSKWENVKLSSDKSQAEIKNILSENILLNSEMNFNFDIFYKIFSEYINGQKFRGSSGRTKEERIKEEIIDINTVEDFFSLLSGDSIINVWEEEKVSIYDFIENKYTIDEIFGDINVKRSLLKAIIENLSKIIMLNADIKVQSGGIDKSVHELSAGMKGTLYTKVKLLTNTFTTPVIFDQPEDDLDNDFIMNNMVSLFRQLKKYRQIIIVTHNPNLVINADAEQIIIAENNNEHITYKSGAIEDVQIRNSICQILEGGSIAFKNREQKYDI